MAQIIIGTVSSKKSDKTIVVTEFVRTTHPVYRKQHTLTRTFMAHDEKNEAKEGDKVAIISTRPLSRRKHFKLDKIVSRAEVKHIEAENPVDGEVQ